MPDGRSPAARGPQARRRAGLTPDVIADTALGIVRRDGVAALTMRNLATELGVQAPSLYAHVRSKDAVLALLGRRLYASVEAGSFGTVETAEDFVVAFEHGARRLRRTYREHPGMAAVMLAQTAPERHHGPGEMAAAINAEVDAMVRLGVPRADAVDFFETDSRWVLGAVLAEESPHPVPDEDERRFDLGLATYLDGMRARLAGYARNRRRPDT